MQPVKPSFLEYFEQKEKEANIQIDGGRKGENHADNRKLPLDGDLEGVSLPSLSGFNGDVDLKGWSCIGVQ